MFHLWVEARGEANKRAEVVYNKVKEKIKSSVGLGYSNGIIKLGSIGKKFSKDRPLGYAICKRLQEDGLRASLHCDYSDEEAEIYWTLVQNLDNWNN